ncbi:hypothetical protein [Zhihengliuella sp.]|uniref:hypothetical protein n=1 Tax=Zhihengliuella sp. TaxID=1954483 RepID=UPI0028114D52|nr:hypothetical protein [Zhihengliuella sp.]
MQTTSPRRSPAPIRVINTQWMGRASSVGPALGPMVKRPEDVEKPWVILDERGRRPRAIAFRTFEELWSQLTEWLADPCLWRRLAELVAAAGAVERGGSRG